jgi:hypothetical protein
MFNFARRNFQKKAMYRQGDVLFIEFGEIPDDFSKSNTNIVVDGEATGHAHRLINGQIYERLEFMVIEAYEGAKMVHEEHRTIKLPKGIYRVVRQREYVKTDDNYSRSWNYVLD